MIEVGDDFGGGRSESGVRENVSLLFETHCITLSFCLPNMLIRNAKGTYRSLPKQQPRR
jgi:hypothetical protein